MTPAAYSAFDMPRDGFRIQVRAFTTNDRAAFEEAVSRTGPGPSTAVSSSSTRVFRKRKTFFMNVDFINHLALLAG